MATLNGDGTEATQNGDATEAHEPLDQGGSTCELTAQEPMATQNGDGTEAAQNGDATEAHEPLDPGGSTCELTAQEPMATQNGDGTEAAQNGDATEAHEPLGPGGSTCEMSEGMSEFEDSDFIPSSNENDSNSDSDSIHEIDVVVEPVPSREDVPIRLDAHRNTEEVSEVTQFGLLPKKEKKQGCKQVYDKVHYCTFCGKGITKICRHLLTVHKSEDRVQPILLLPKRSEERMVREEVLTNEGNFKHNLKVLQDKKGYLVVGRREKVQNKFQTNAYLPCEYCRKFILKETLWIHHRCCKVKRFFLKDNQSSQREEASSNPLRHSRQLLNSALMSDSEGFVAKLLTRMQDGELKEIVQNDDLIRKYAALRVEALGSDIDQKTNDMHRVSQRCRTLARLVQECKLKNKTNILNMDNLICPEHFDLVVSATKALAIDRNVVSLGRYMGNIIGHMIETKKGDALRKNDDKRCQQADNFQKLFHAEWNCRVNSVCTKRNNTLQRQKIKTIPFTEDLKNLKDYVITCMRDASLLLKNNGSEKDWLRLSKLTLCRLILFNKRRPAEVKELKIDDFVGRPKWKEQQEGEFAMALSESDKLLAERMDMVISAGKSRKNVDAYVLLPPDAKQAIELLIEQRHKFTQPSNKYIFARLHSDTPLTGHTDLKEIVAECPGLKFPERITSTSLRKYIATVSQILDMTDSELEMLANHLGHDVKTHKENYRLSHSTRELTVVSQLLVAVENGYVNTFKGKHLSSISVNDLPDVLDSLDANTSLVDKEAEIRPGYDSCPLEIGIEVNDKPEDLDLNTSADIRHTSSVEGQTSYVEGTTGSVERNTGSVEENTGSVEENTGSVEENTGSVEENTGSVEGNDELMEENIVSIPVTRKRTAWSVEENNILRKKFKNHLLGKVSSIHNSDLKEVQGLLCNRTLPQIRSKINNIKHGKCK